jgi:hypothetical protein
VGTVTRALTDVDDPPSQAIEFLGLMAQAGHANALVSSGGLALIQSSLKGSVGSDDDMATACVTAVGRVAGGFQGPSSHAFGGVRDAGVALSLSVLNALRGGHLKTPESQRCAVQAMLWLAREDPALAEFLAGKGAADTLVAIITYVSPRPLTSMVQAMQAGVV